MSGNLCNLCTYSLCDSAFLLLLLLLFILLLLLLLLLKILLRRPCWGVRVGAAEAAGQEEVRRLYLWPRSKFMKDHWLLFFFFLSKGNILESFVGGSLRCTQTHSGRSLPNPPRFSSSP